MTELPDFTAEGMLPPGDYLMTIAELKSSMLVTGPRDRRTPGWNAVWRKRLVDNLGVLVAQLQRVGIKEIFVGGSFAEDKSVPNDIDGYFEVEKRRFITGDLQRELNAIDPQGIWTWDWPERKAFRKYPKPQLPMWHAYRVELYPHYGQLSGISDVHGKPLEFPAAFRMSRLGGKPRGIIRIGGT